MKKKYALSLWILSAIINMSKNLLPFNTHQIITWLVLAIDAMAYILYLFPLFTSREQIIFSLVFASIFWFLLLTGIFMMCSKPTATPKPLEMVDSDEEVYELYCETCDIYVNEGTKHCGKCNICIEGFDHHCKWLNKCIGSKNYKLFFLLIVFMLLLSLVLVFLEAYTFSAWALDSEKIDRIVVLAINGTYSFAIVISISFLIAFHMYLWNKGMRTYDFIKSREKIQPTVDYIQDNVPDKNEFVAITERDDPEHT